MQYVGDAAWVQAQLLSGVRGIGWNVGLADELGKYHSSDEAFAAYRHTIAKCIDRGQIRVNVPRLRIMEWKGHSQHIELSSR